jgi:hypothetical protein
MAQTSWSGMIGLLAGPVPEATSKALVLGGLIVFGGDLGPAPASGFMKQLFG